MLKKWVSVVVILCGVSIFGSGCVSDETVTEPKEPVQEANKGKVETNAEIPSFTFAMSGQFKPFHFTEGDQLQGFDVELGQEIAKRLGAEASPMTEEQDSLFQGLEQDQYDAVIGSISITPRRLEQVNFSDPYYVSGPQFFVRETEEGTEEPILSVQDLTSKRVGVVQTSIYASLGEQYAKQVDLYPDEVAMLQALASKQIDAVLMDRTVGIVAVHEENVKMKELGDVLYKDEIGIAVKKGNEKLLAQINQVLQEIVADGTFGQLSTKWFGVNIQ